MIDALKNKHVTFLGTITASVLAGVAVLTFTTFQLYKSLTFIDCIYAGTENQPRLVLASMEILRGEDGPSLRGYQLELIDLLKGASVSKVFLPRSEENIPPLPLINHINEQIIWLVQQREFIQGNMGFMAKFGIENDKIKLSESRRPDGYAVERAGQAKYVRLLNKYNEPHCYNLAESKHTEGECPAGIPEPYENRKTAFILVNKTAASSRYHLYYYETDKGDPMNISVGSGKGQSLLYRLWFSQNRLSHEELLFYKGQMKPKDKLIEIFTSDYLVSASALYSDTEIAIYADNPTESTQRIMCFNKQGKMLWIVDDRKYFRKDKDTPIKARGYGKIMLLFSNHWAIGMNRESNKMQWSYAF